MARQDMKRLARPTLGYSKRFENHEHATHLHMFFYNRVRKHETLKATPGVAAGLDTKPLTMLDLVTMIENAERIAAKRLTNHFPATS